MPGREQEEEDDLSLFERFMERFFGGGEANPVQGPVDPAGGVRTAIDESTDPNAVVGKNFQQPPIIIQMPQPAPAANARSAQADRTLEALAQSRSELSGGRSRNQGTRGQSSGKTIAGTKKQTAAQIRARRSRAGPRNRRK